MLGFDKLSPEKSDKRIQEEPKEIVTYCVEARNSPKDSELIKDNFVILCTEKYQDFVIGKLLD